MARAKKEADEIKLDDYVTRIRQEVNKQFGAGTCIGGTDIIARDNRIIPWSPSLDMLTGGGIQEGTWLSVSGPPKQGKTAALLKLAVNMQRAGKVVYYMNIEGRIKDKDLSNVKGLDTSPDKFVIFTTTPEKILSSQDYLSIMETVLRTHPGAFIIADSMSALADERELENGPGTQLRGANYIPIGQFINNLGPFVSCTKSVFAGIVHKIANTSGKGAPTSERVGNRFKFQADYQLESKYIEKWKHGESVIGQITHWHQRSSAIGPPFKDCSTYIRYGTGIDDTFETFQYACDCGLISKAGSWYSFTFLENHPELNIDKMIKFQGGEECWQYLNENPTITNVLTEDVKKFSDILIKDGGD